MHLSFIGEELEKELFKTAVKIPVDSAYIVAELILAVIRELYGLTVGSDQMLTAEESAKIGAKLKRERFETTEKRIV
jgi:hypothetical protein